MIQRLVAPNPGLMTGAGTNTYLLADGRGGVAIVDPGPADAGHLVAVLAAAEALGRITALLVTHGHADHLPGALALRERTGAPLLGHARLPGVDRPLADGASCGAPGGVELVALETPGHTDDSVCFWEPRGRALFAGDLVAGTGTVIVDEGRGGLARYLASLERVLGLARSTLHPGHGPLVADGAARLREYLAHRARREEQVLMALGDLGSASVERIVAAIYVGLVPELRAMAARNVRAHLRKLEDEGRAHETERGWRLTAGRGG